MRGKAATVTEESKPTTQASPLLFDLTSLQREANGKFGFSAKTTLALAQSLYERHKALTYPRTDSRALPEDYLPVAKDTFGMLATSGMRHLAPYARQALDENYVRPSKRIFDNAKVSDHFAIIPTTQAPSGLSEAEQKLYDLVVRRFMAVFFPSAEYLVTTRISQVVGHSFKTEGKVLVKPGWLAIYGKEAANEVEDGKAGDKGQPLVPVKPGEMTHTEYAEAKALKTKPPARYSEATLLGAMESAGKQVEDEELRSAMQEKGLGTPATRAAIIEGLLTEKYMLREGRELIPTTKAFQLMTLLRGLGVEELSRAELTGEWEYKLAQMEKGQLSREAFMQQIAAMTERMVKKAKEYDRDTIPGNYATLSTPCPNCGGVVKENYRRYACTGADGRGDGCGFSFTKSPAGRTFEPAEAEALLRDRRIGPLEGFRSKAGWPFTAEVAIVRDEEAGNFKLEFDFGDDRAGEASGELVEFTGEPLGPCPICGAPVHEHGSNYVCSKAVPTAAQPTPSCTFKSGKVILQQHVEREQMAKLLATGKDRPARQVREHAHAPQLQGLPGVGQGGRQGELRVRAAREQVPAAQVRRQGRRGSRCGEGGHRGRGQEGRQARRQGRREEVHRRRQGPAQDRGRQAAERRPGRGDRPGADRPARSSEEDVGIHQGPQSAGPQGQAHHQGRRQAARGVRQGIGRHVRAGGNPGQAPARRQRMTPRDTATPATSPPPRAPGR